MIDEKYNDAIFMRVRVTGWPGIFLVRQNFIDKQAKLENYLKISNLI